ASQRSHYRTTRPSILEPHGTVRPPQLNSIFGNTTVFMPSGVLTCFTRLHPLVQLTLVPSGELHTMISKSAVLTCARPAAQAIATRITTITPNLSAPLFIVLLLYRCTPPPGMSRGLLKFSGGSGDDYAT